MANETNTNNLCEFYKECLQTCDRNIKNTETCYIYKLKLQLEKEIDKKIDFDNEAQEYHNTILKLDGVIEELNKKIIRQEKKYAYLQKMLKTKPVKFLEFLKII